MSLSGVVPKHSTYVQGGLPIGIDSKRRTIRLVPQTGGSGYTPNGNNVIRIDIPPSIGFLDTQNSYLRFRIKVAAANVNLSFPCYMDTNAMSWCDRFEVISNNGSVLESIHDYNLLVNLLHKATSPDDYRLTAGKLLDNEGTRSERAANLASGRMYCAGLDASGIFGGNTKYLPCQFVQGSLTMEFQLAQFADCFVGRATAAAQASYTIDNVEYVAECINFGQDFNNIFEQELRTRGVDIAFHSYRSHHHAISSQSEQTIQLSQNSKSVKGCYCVLRDKDEYRSAKCESLSTYKSGRLTDYQFDLGGRLFPEFRMDVRNGGGSSAYASALNSFNHFRDHNGGTAVRKETFVPHGVASGLVNVNTSTKEEEITQRIWGTLRVIAAAAGPIAAQTVCFKPLDTRDLADIKYDRKYKLAFIEATYAGDASIMLHAVQNKVSNLVATQTQKNRQYVYCLGSDTLGGIVLGSRPTSDMYSPDTHLMAPLVSSAAVPNAANYATALPYGDAANPTNGKVVCLDLVPDDSDFYIGQSFETHEEHESMVSGMDTTNTVPLHVNLKFAPGTAAGGANLPVKTSDLLTAFLHYDAVMRIEPDGSVVSSM